MKNKNNYCSLIIVVLFILAIFTPFAGAILQEDRGLSYTEKRKLQQMPNLPGKFDEIGGFIADFEKYYNDQFGMRDTFLKSYGAVKKVLGDHDISSNTKNIGTKNIIKGKDGWFFLNRKWDGDPISDYRNITLYGEGELIRATLLFAARTHWLKNRGIEYLLFFAPNKHTIYSEHLPDYIKKQGQISSMDQLNDALSRYTSVNFVDLRKPLLDGKKEAAKYWKENKEQAALYFKKDSHWNSGGADIAQFEVARRLEKIFPGKIKAAKRNLDDFTMLNFAGDITLIMGGKEEDAYGPVLMSGTCTPEKLMDYLQRSHTTNCYRGKLNAMIFYDSFFPPLKPFFTDYFSTTVYRWERMRRAKVEKVMAETKLDLVIEQRAERHLPFTPYTGGEYYHEFWAEHYHKWKKKVYTMDLKEAGKGKLRSYNVEMKYKGKKGLRIRATTDDPHVYLPDMPFKKEKLYLIQCELTSPVDTTLQFYYSAIDKINKYPTEPFSVRVKVKKGENRVFLPLFSMDLAGGLRIDPGMKKGDYFIKQLEVKELNLVNLKK